MQEIIENIDDAIEGIDALPPAANPKDASARTSARAKLVEAKAELTPAPTGG